MVSLVAKIEYVIINSNWTQEITAGQIVIFGGHEFQELCLYYVVEKIQILLILLYKITHIFT